MRSEDHDAPTADGRDWAAHRLDSGGLDRLIEILRADGRRVLGPRAEGGVIGHGDIDRVADLPVGWTEEQDPGRYRLIPTGTAEAFAFSSPSTSWKQYLTPPRTLLVRTRRTADGIDVEPNTPDVERLAFLGVRSCDLAAIGVLDRVYGGHHPADPTYAARRSDLVIIAVGCAHPGRTCFCVSMDTGPSPTSGFDVSLSELVDDAGSVAYLATAGSEIGADLLRRVSEAPSEGGECRPATDDDRAAARTIHDRAVASMGRTLDPSDPPRAAAVPDHERWQEVAERCLACGNCTMVCPTCFCTTTEDTTDLEAMTSERWRIWDSCFTLDFTHMHEGPTRSSTASRYRQWLLHKLVTWHDQFDTSGCVGCGRCITWCPVGIDLTEEIAALARSHEAPA